MRARPGAAQSMRIGGRQVPPPLPAGAKLAAIISLVLWIGIACAGRGIGYIEPPLDKIHAGLLYLR